MTRIKEYMELLTSEMEAFRSDVNRLETINERIKDLKVSIDLKELKAEFKEHSSQLEKQRKHQERFYTRMELLFQKSRDLSQMGGYCIHCSNSYFGSIIALCLQDKSSFRKVEG